VGVSSNSANVEYVELSSAAQARGVLDVRGSSQKLFSLPKTFPKIELLRRQVCVDLARSQPKAATATASPNAALVLLLCSLCVMEVVSAACFGQVIGIIDGTGAFGAAVGQQIVAHVSDAYGWEAVFSVLIVALLVSATMVTPMALADFRLLRIGRGGERALLAGQAQGAGAGAVSTDGQAAQ
jgi:hypothetical protein